MIHPYCVEPPIARPIPLGYETFKYVESIILEHLSVLKFLEIGNDCFGLVKTFRIEHMNSLKYIRIGKNSFTQKKNYWGNDKSKSFHILNCESLESIEIGECSFSDFAGDFELKNLPELELIKIGQYGNRSLNFCKSSFEVTGKGDELRFEV